MKRSCFGQSRNCTAIKNAFSRAIGAVSPLLRTSHLISVTAIFDFFSDRVMNAGARSRWKASASRWPYAPCFATRASPEGCDCALWAPFREQTCRNFAGFACFDHKETEGPHLKGNTEGRLGRPGQGPARLIAIPAPGAGTGTCKAVKTRV